MKNCPAQTTREAPSFPIRETFIVPDAAPRLLYSADSFETKRDQPLVSIAGSRSERIARPVA